jgi:ADP-dependent phosphofructokinase/glucokinase
MEIDMKIICAYPINLDAIHDVKGKETKGLSNIFKPKLKEKIASINDLFSVLLYCMQEGCGAELLVEGEELAQNIQNSFSWRYRLGGNAGIMANVLAKLGAHPVLNAPALSKRMAEMLHPGVGVPVSGGLMDPLSAAGDREMIHFVFQFIEGEEVVTPSGKIVAQRDNRLIATFDPFNSRLQTNPDFDSFCRNEISDFDGALVSGFHLVPQTRYKEIFEPRIEQIRSWKEANPSIFIHAEMGSFQKPEIMKYLMKRLPVDSLGLNEDELARAVDLESGWRGMLDGVLQLKRSRGFPRVSVHARDFILSAVEPMISAESEMMALTRGADAAAKMASTGDIFGTLPEEINPSGLKAKEDFCAIGADPLGRGAVMHSGDSTICFVPSLLVRHPRFTVGLGDTATAAIFYEEVMARKKCIDGSKNRS